MRLFLHRKEHIRQLFIGRNFPKSALGNIQSPLNTVQLLKRSANTHARIFNMCTYIRRIAVSNENRLPTLRVLCVN
ncbi:hypothetical protein WJ78_24590 [Burkholderia ubonensis]|nr:hypothetical protein WJ78_24590 [Burkholderia ubonensis]KVP91229.1 hypothetical protein WJ97_03685 [Burkholderia ubonensis]OJB45016.1 hypothetical protein BGV57_06155 [Burkholderia ubonensis]